MKKLKFFKICIILIFPLCIYSQSENREIIFKYDKSKDWDNEFNYSSGTLYLNKNNGETSDLNGFMAYRTSKNVVKKLGGQTWTCYNVKLVGTDGSTAAELGYKDDAVFIKFNNKGKDVSYIYLKWTTNNINCGSDIDIKWGTLYCELCNGQIATKPYHIQYDNGRCYVITGADYMYPKNYHQNCAKEKCERD